MPPIKITLNRLIELFGKSVNSDLPDPVRALAARLMTLTAHTMRIDQKIDVRVKALSEQIATLTDIVQALAQPQGAAPAATAEAPAATVQPAEAPAPTDATPTKEASEEEEAEAAFFAHAQREAEAEVAAINAAASEPEPAPVTVLPRGKKVGGAK
jgi:ribosomal protein L12E/L44/L45/RPP1/RPP2